MLRRRPPASWSSSSSWRWYACRPVVLRGLMEAMARRGLAEQAERPAATAARGRGKNRTRFAKAVRKNGEHRHAPQMQRKREPGWSLMPAWSRYPEGYKPPAPDLRSQQTLAETINGEIAVHWWLPVFGTRSQTRGLTKLFRSVITVWSPTRTEEIFQQVMDTSATLIAQRPGEHRGQPQLQQPRRRRRTHTRTQTEAVAGTRNALHRSDEEEQTSRQQNTASSSSTLVGLLGTSDDRPGDSASASHARGTATSADSSAEEAQLRAQAKKLSATESIHPGDSAAQGDRQHQHRERRRRAQGKDAHVGTGLWFTMDSEHLCAGMTQREIIILLRNAAINKLPDIVHNLVARLDARIALLDRNTPELRVGRASDNRRRPWRGTRRRRWSWVTHRIGLELNVQQALLCVGEYEMAETRLGELVERMRSLVPLRMIDCWVLWHPLLEYYMEHHPKEALRVSDELAKDPAMPKPMPMWAAPPLLSSLLKTGNDDLCDDILRHWVESKNYIRQGTWRLFAKQSRTGAVLSREEQLERLLRLYGLVLQVEAHTVERDHGQHGGIPPEIAAQAADLEILQEDDPHEVYDAMGEEAVDVVGEVDIAGEEKAGEEEAKVKDAEDDDETLNEEAVLENDPEQQREQPHVGEADPAAATVAGVRRDDLLQAPGGGWIPFPATANRAYLGRLLLATASRLGKVSIVERLLADARLKLPQPLVSRAEALLCVYATDGDVERMELVLRLLEEGGVEWRNDPKLLRAMLYGHQQSQDLERTVRAGQYVMDSQTLSVLDIARVVDVFAAHGNVDAVVQLEKFARNTPMRHFANLFDHVQPGQPVERKQNMAKHVHAFNSMLAKAHAMNGNVEEVVDIVSADARRTDDSALPRLIELTIALGVRYKWLATPTQAQASDDAQDDGDARNPDDAQDKDSGDGQNGVLTLSDLSNLTIDADHPALQTLEPFIKRALEPLPGYLRTDKQPYTEELMWQRCASWALRKKLRPDLAVLMERLAAARGYEFDAFTTPAPSDSDVFLPEELWEVTRELRRRWETHKSLFPTDD